MIILSVIKFNKELRLSNTPYFQQFTDVVAAGDSNDHYIRAICCSGVHRMPACCIYEPGWIYVLYYLINYNKLFINRRTI